MGSKSVQHGEIYLCAYFEENSWTGMRVIALFMLFLMFKVSKIFPSENTEQNSMKLGLKHLWYVYNNSYVRYGCQPKNFAAVNNNRILGSRCSFVQITRKLLNLAKFL